MNRADRRRLARKIRRVASGSDTFTRAERHELQALMTDVADVMPVHLRDQIDAAQAHVATGMRRLMMTRDDVTPAQTTSRILTNRVDQIITRLMTGDCRCCPHVTPSAPQPVSVTLWDDPPHFRCGRCLPDDFGLTEAEDRTCDLCGIDTAGDGIRPTITHVGAVTVAFGSCHACHDTLTAEAA